MRIPEAGGPCWVDGRRVDASEATVPLESPALQAGFGLFETIALRSGRLLDLDAHLDRIYAGGDRLGLLLPARPALRETVLDAAGPGAPACGWLKIIVVGEGRSYVFRGAMDPRDEGREASAVLLPWRRNANDPVAGLKSLSYAGNLLGLEHARRHGADEGLWLNTRGHLAEGCASNLFVVQGRKVFTPGTGEGILPGVVRGLAIAATRGLGLALHEGKIRLPRLERADEAFLTSSLRGVRPLVRLQGRRVGSGRPGAVTKRIAAEVARTRQGDLESGGGRP